MKMNAGDQNEREKLSFRMGERMRRRKEKKSGQGKVCPVMGAFTRLGKRETAKEYIQDSNSEKAILKNGHLW